MFVFGEPFILAPVNLNDSCRIDAFHPDAQHHTFPNIVVPQIFGAELGNFGVRLNSLSVNSMFLSQNGTTTNNGFQLYYSSGAQVWAFGRHSTDASGAVWRAAYGSKATTGQWTHLVGVYDATAKELRLYVNGKLTGTRDWTDTPWNATGPVQIGRKLSSGTYGEYANASACCSPCSGTAPSTNPASPRTSSSPHDPSTPEPPKPGRGALTKDIEAPPRRRRGHRRQP